MAMVTTSKGSKRNAEEHSGVILNPNGVALVNPK
jgi:hypothetical protein